jgi:hypothetical protein
MNTTIGMAFGFISADYFKKGDGEIRDLASGCLAKNTFTTKKLMHKASFHFPTAKFESKFHDAEYFDYYIDL